MSFFIVYKRKYGVEKVISRLENEISKLGGKLQAVPISLLPSVQKEWMSCIKKLEGTQMYLRMLQDYYNFSLENKLDRINSLMIIALPSPPCYIKIEGNSVGIEIDIPPAYLNRDKQLAMIKQIVEELFEPQGFHSWPVVLPKKILAAMSGFGKYGRNNLLYVEGLGSCHRLTVFASDFIVSEPMKANTDLRMEHCSSCGICMRTCPTGAITKENTMINQDRCLTFHNEMRQPFPDWLQEEWHHNLVGCTRCQEYCPANRGKWNREKIATFTKDEVQQIMEDLTFEELNRELQNKLTDTSLYRYYPILSRNLKLLLKAKE